MGRHIFNALQVSQGSDHGLHQAPDVCSKGQRLLSIQISLPPLNKRGRFLENCIMVCLVGYFGLMISAIIPLLWKFTHVLIPIASLQVWFGVDTWFSSQT